MLGLVWAIRQCLQGFGDFWGCGGLTRILGERRAV